MSSHLQISRLILVGHRKNYVIKLNPGLNIIYGDSDTGKSTILEFIDYLLGSSSIELADEVKSSVDHAALEIIVDDSYYTVKRSIFNSSELIDVYHSNFEDTEKHIPERYAPNYKTKSGASGFYSDFLLDLLNLPKISIKVSPTQKSSDIKRLGFRSVFKFCYLDQDKVGGKSFLDLGNWSQATSTREVFKYIFNVLDSKISDLECLISDKTKESKALKEQFSHVSEFLRGIEEESEEYSNLSLDDIEGIIENLKKELAQVNSNMTASSDSYTEIKSLFDETNLLLKGTTQKLLQTESIVDKYSKLKNDYQNDIDKTTALIVSKSSLNATAIDSFPCPVCETQIEQESMETVFSVEPVEAIKQELTSLKSRKRNIEELLTTQHNLKKELLRQENQLKRDIVEIRSALDTESEQMITPFLTQRDNLVAEIASMSQLKKTHIKNLKITNQQEKLAKKFATIDLSLEGLDEQLKALIKDAPDIHKILTSLTNRFDRFLKTVNIKNKTGVRISESTFAPVIRGRDYYKITSGGLRTIASIGHLLSILDFALDNDVNHPRLLMIDTVGKYLGKTTSTKYLEETDSNADNEEGISDPIKYKNIYEKILDTVDKTENNDSKCQVILVDNDVPEAFVERYKCYIVAHYSSKGVDGLKTGLIDDFKLEPHDEKVSKDEEEDPSSGLEFEIDL